MEFFVYGAEPDTYESVYSELAGTGVGEAAGKRVAKVRFTDGADEFIAEVGRPVERKVQGPNPNRDYWRSDEEAVVRTMIDGVSLRVFTTKSSVGGVRVKSEWENPFYVEKPHVIQFWTFDDLD